MPTLHTKKIILWDLHEVLFTRSLWHWFYLFLTYKHKWVVIHSIDWHIFSLFFRYALHVLHIKRAELTSQELIDYARTKKLDKLVDLTVLIGSDYTPIPETVAIIRALHEQGYIQYICSNIGHTVLDHFSKKYPIIFGYFNGTHIVHYNNGTLIKKPNPQFFIDFLHTYSYAPSELIFIDDKKYNIQAAQEYGIESILFRNATELKKDLHKKSIFI